MPYSRHEGSLSNLNPFALLLVLLEMLSRHMVYTSSAPVVMQSVHEQWMQCMNKVLGEASDADVQLEDAVWKCIVDGGKRLEHIQPRICSFIMQQDQAMLLFGQ